MGYWARRITVMALSVPLFAMFLCIDGSALAEDVTFDGNGSFPSGGGGTGTVLGPNGSGISDSILWNTVVVKNINVPELGTIPSRVIVYGATNSINSNPIYNNTVTIEDSFLESDALAVSSGRGSAVYGGYAGEPTSVDSYASVPVVSNNHTIIRNSTAGHIYGGYVSRWGGGPPQNIELDLRNHLAGNFNANGNTVEISGNSEVWEVDGGGAYVSTSSLHGFATPVDIRANANVSANGNRVKITDSTVGYNITGGDVTLFVDSIDMPSSSGNPASFYPVTANGTLAATANDNQVIIENSESLVDTVGWDFFDGGIEGGYASTYASMSDACDLTVTSTAARNQVTINGNETEVSGDIVGGVANVHTINSQATAISRENSVIINAGTVDSQNDIIMGGRALSEGSDGHGAYIPDSFGTATAADNSVVINGGSVTLRRATVVDPDPNDSLSPDNDELVGIFGGFAEAETGAATARGNRIVIAGGAVKVEASGLVGGEAISDSGSATAIDNRVEIASDGTEAIGYIEGGVSSSSSGDAVTTNNTVIITKGIVGNTHGGTSVALLGSANASNNTVIIKGGRVTSGVGGANVSSGNSTTANNNSVLLEDGIVEGDFYGAYATAGRFNTTGTATASHNMVTVNGGTVLGDIYGAQIHGDGVQTATHNIITIGGDANVYNGYISGAITDDYRYGIPGNDIFTGNTLIKNSATAVRDVHNFEFIRFGYSGDANIDEIDLSGGEVKLDTGSRSIAYAGTFSGTGSLTKIGSGVLAFGRNMSLGGKMTVREGTLSISESLSIAAAGGLFFGEGSEFTPNGNKLSVNGGVSIDSGARINISDIDVGNTVLASDRAIAGSFNLDSWFYKTAFSDDRKEFSVIGEFSAEEKGGNIVAALANSGVTTGKNGVKGMGQLMSMLDRVGPEVEKELIRQLEGYVALADRGDTSAAAVGVQQILGSHSVRAARATRAVARSFGGAVSGRLAQMRDYQMAMNDAPAARSNDAYASLPGPRRTNTARGDYGYSAMANRIWAGGFGSFANQRDDDGEFGYDYNSGGFILGYDHRFGDSLTVGLSGAYSHGKIDGNDGRSETDVDTMNLGVYASYDTPGGFYADANLGLGFTWNEEDERLVLGGRRSGKFETSSFQLGGNVGYVFRLPSAFRLVPTIGLQYIHVRQDGYEQSGDALAMWRDASSANYLEVPIAMRVNRTFELGGGVSVMPELRAAWIIEAKQDDASVRTGFAGNRNASMLVSGTNPGKHRGLVGAGVKFRLGDRFDAFLNYNLEFRKRYTNHNIMAGVGVSF